MNINLTLDRVHELSLDALVGCGASSQSTVPVAESVRDAKVRSLYHEWDGIYSMVFSQLSVRLSR